MIYKRVTRASHGQTRESDRDMDCVRSFFFDSHGEHRGQTREGRCAVTRYHVQYRLLDSHVRHRSEGKYTYLPVTPKPVRYNLAVQDSVSDTSDVYGQ